MADPARAEAVRRLREYVHARRQFVVDSRNGLGPSPDEVYRAEEAILRPLTEGIRLEGMRKR